MVAGRRRALVSLATATAGLALGRWFEANPLLVAAALAQAPAPGGRLVATLPLGRLDRRAKAPLHTLLGSGLDARQFTDLSELAPGRLITPADQFYIRTAAPRSLPSPAVWQILLGGLVTQETRMAVTDLRDRARPMGAHLLECAGNADPANFGLLSAATWSGVPIGRVLDQLRPTSQARRIRITGLDDDGQSATSVPGAAWVFTRDELEERGAFLATDMNEAALTPHHGAPVRLVMPNYYGCSNIKWVTRIDAVPDDEPATTQMREFAARTHQHGVPALAREFQPPAIDLAATPIRVEQWEVPDGRGAARQTYRVVGIRWGGSSRRAPLTIRFGHRQPFVPVEYCPDADSTTTWSLWTHTWRPERAGRYQIALGVADPGIPARRLDLFYYTREVDVAQV